MRIATLLRILAFLLVVSSVSLVFLAYQSTRGTSGESGGMEEEDVLRRLRRPSFPNTEPDICAVLITQNRLELARRTLAAFLQHAERDHVSFELVWIDNGSDNTRRQVDSFAADTSHLIDFPLRLPHNRGLPFALNAAIAGLCRARFMLSLEEDWEVREDAPPGVLSRAMRLLQRDQTVLSVFLRDERDESAGHIIDDRWTELETGIRYRRHDSSCSEEDEQTAHKCGRIWGAWSNGGSLVDRRKLARVGLQAEREDGYFCEANYARRALEAGFRGAHMHVHADEPNCTSTKCNAIFTHLGEGYRSPAWANVSQVAVVKLKPPIEWKTCPRSPPPKK